MKKRPGMAHFFKSEVFVASWQRLTKQINISECFFKTQFWKLWRKFFIWEINSLSWKEVFLSVNCFPKMTPGVWKSSSKFITVLIKVKERHGGATSFALEHRFNGLGNLKKLKNGPSPASFSFSFGLFKQTSLQFLRQINVKNVVSIQYMVLRFKPPTFGTWVSPHNH